MKKTKPTAKRIRKPYDLDTARIEFLGIKGKPWIDAQGRTSAIGRYRYEFADCVIAGDHFENKPIPGESFEIEVQMYLDPVYGWQPNEGIESVAKRACQELALSLEDPAKDGKAWREQLEQMRDKKNPDRAERIENAQRCADTIRQRAPKVYFTVKGMLRNIAEKTGIPISTLRDWQRDGDLKLPPLYPDE
jgi:hypothetical protein